MPRYYFNIWENGHIFEDREGVELTDLEAAPEECRKIILSVLQEERSAEDLRSNAEMRVVDELGGTVLRVPFRAVLSALRLVG